MRRTRVVPMGAAAPNARRWLFGPLPDLIFGCGLGYALVFGLLTVEGDGVRNLFPYGLAPLLSLVTGTPHYGATLLRVYEKRESRRRYTAFALYATLALCVAFAASLRHAFFGSILLTLYLTWSPWHYSGQNYGIALMFLRRRGFEVTPTAKRCLYASFLLSFLLTVLALHGGGPDYSPLDYAGTGYAFLPLGIPRAVERAAVPVLALAYLASLTAATGLLARGGRLRDLLPVAVLAGTQALWFSLPVAARHYAVLGRVDPLSQSQAAYAFLWIAAGHAVQYLWITTYYAKISDPGVAKGSYLLKALLAGAAVWVVPALLFAPAALGPRPFDAGLAVMVAACVNIHHFLLDGAIWKLRSGRIARILIRDGGEAAQAGPAAIGERRRGSWKSGLVWAAGAVSVAVLLVDALESEFGVRRALAAGDFARVERAQQWLSWIGRESAVVRANAGLLALSAGDLRAARREVERSLALEPTPEGYYAQATLHEYAGQRGRAILPYREALALRPDWVPAANNLAWIRATHENPLLRDGGEALDHARLAARLTRRRDPTVLDTLAAAYAETRDFEHAALVCERALAQARTAGAAQLEATLARHLALYRSHQPLRVSEAQNAAQARRQKLGLLLVNRGGERVGRIAVRN